MKKVFGLLLVVGFVSVNLTVLAQRASVESVNPSKVTCYGDIVHSGDHDIVKCYHCINVTDASTYSDERTCTP